MNWPVIAVDGPTASGKGTVASGVARTLGFHYLDSGALYRLTALAALRAGIAVDDPVELGKVAGHLDVAFRDGSIWLAGVDVTESIRTEAVGNAASALAVFAQVRDALLSRQRAFLEPPGLVADGRDMGTVVFPDARLKVFLTADVAARAARRTKQLMEKGIFANLTTLSEELQERDRRDATRALAPLAPADDAVIIDSSSMTAQAVIERIVELYRGH